MVGHFPIDGRPVISVPVPHGVDHPGLAQFTSSSIIPCLRFYSFTFRTFILLAWALVIIARPLFRLVKRYGWDAPEAFRNQTGMNTFHPNFRSADPENDLIRLQDTVYASIFKLY
jgi:hypothetical protein